jgi:hypothetical protein
MKVEGKKDPNRGRFSVLVKRESPWSTDYAYGDTPEEATAAGHEWIKNNKMTELGANADGYPLFEDGRGVRSYVKDGIRITEPVTINPRGEISIHARAPEFEPAGPIDYEAKFEYPKMAQDIADEFGMSKGEHEAHSFFLSKDEPDGSRSWLKVRGTPGGVKVTAHKGHMEGRVKSGVARNSDLLTNIADVRKEVQDGIKRLGFNEPKGKPLADVIDEYDAKIDALIKTDRRGPARRSEDTLPIRPLEGRSRRGRGSPVSRRGFRRHSRGPQIRQRERRRRA